MRNTMAELGITRDSTVLTTVPLDPPLSPVLHTNSGVSGIAEADQRSRIRRRSNTSNNSKIINVRNIANITSF
jgi:hypothetical protein